MAVTLTALQLAAAMRIGDGSTALVEPQATQISRILATATAIVEKYAPLAPENVQNEAVVRLGAYLFDTPPGASASLINAFSNSGAQALLHAFRINRAYVIETDEEHAARMRQ